MLLPAARRDKNRRRLIVRTLALLVPFSAVACGARSPLFDVPAPVSTTPVPTDDAGPPVDAGTPRDGSVAPPNPVVFGGTFNDGNDVALSDTWEWTGVAWSYVDVVGPPGRYAASMASLGGIVVLFGGQGALGTTLADTWTWNGTVWSEVAASGPSPRSGAAMAALGNEIVLFGGFGVGPGSPDAQSLGDTWTFDGSTWTPHDVPSPAARDSAMMASLAGQVVLYGGRSQSDGLDYFDDTWTWDGSTWANIGVAGPPSRSNAVLVPLNGKLLLFGGECYCGGTSGTFYADTWTWDGATWTLLDASAPAATEAVMAPFQGKAILFGGLTPDQGSGALLDSSETSVWDGASWTQVTELGPTGRNLAAITTPEQ